MGRRIYRWDLKEPECLSFVATFGEYFWNGSNWAIVDMAREHQLLIASKFVQEIVWIIFMILNVSLNTLGGLEKLIALAREQIGSIVLVQLNFFKLNVSFLTSLW